MGRKSSKKIIKKTKSELELWIETEKKWMKNMEEEQSKIFDGIYSKPTSYMTAGQCTCTKLKVGESCQINQKNV